MTYGKTYVQTDRVKLFRFNEDREKPADQAQLGTPASAYIYTKQIQTGMRFVTLTSIIQFYQYLMCPDTEVFFKQSYGLFM